MLTRLQVSGFKNLVDVDVYFGPFTCIAGANGVGKSNLFDAIRFLSALADRPLVEAARSVRDESGRTTDVRSLFHRFGEGVDREMSFAAEIIIPAHGVDDLGQAADAAITFLRYEIVLALRDQESSFGELGPLEIKRETLRHIQLGKAAAHLHFPHAAGAWRLQAVKGRRSAPYFISTVVEEGTGTIIKVHADSGQDSGGRPLSRAARLLPRSVLSVSNASESPTAFLVRKEMRGWKLLQLEPTALRRPDSFTSPVHLGDDGSHLPATLAHLARSVPNDAALYARVANRLASLIDDVRSVHVDRDDRRDLLTIEVTDRAGTRHPARSLSDGTLRFLALAVIEIESEGHGVLCLEEPENGVHPERVPAMLQLLQDIAADVSSAPGPENPLRQVIVNTHSPLVVAQVPDDSLLVAERKEFVDGGTRFPRVVFSSLPDTWRSQVDDAPRPVARGQLLAYLNPLESRSSVQLPLGRRRRVIDRPDLQMLLPLAVAAGE